MQHRPPLRPARLLAAACLVLVVVTGCSESPLESVGERSNTWICPIADGVTFLSNDSAPTDQAGPDTAASSVRVTEGTG